ncbi:MAG: NAD(P)H-dependent oxidoreductase subunit E [Actinomycetota bacterium]
MAVIDSPTALEQYRKRLLESRASYKATITVCGGTGCHAHGCGAIYEETRRTLKELGLAETVELRYTGCHGFSERGPLMVIKPQGIFHTHIDPEDVRKIVERTVVAGEIIPELAYRDPVSGKTYYHEHEVPFYGKQIRLLLGMNENIDPCSIDDYIAQGVYTALVKALFQMRPEEINAEVEKAGLRARGGAGFPTADKWKATRRAESRDGIKYVLCNADEGDPGAYMDRSLLEGNPYAVLEGMTIGAYAIGARQRIYLRKARMSADGIKPLHGHRAGKGLGSTGREDTRFRFRIRRWREHRGWGLRLRGVHRPHGLHRGSYRRTKVKHIYTAVRGLYDRPTNLYNVETWANVPIIINRGAEEYAKLGTERSKGTKIFSLVGKVRNTGLIEVPMGITLREIIYGIGSGIVGDKKFKAVRTERPSGCCIPEDLLDTPVDSTAFTMRVP